jgi:hypothetical protein
MIPARDPHFQLGREHGVDGLEVYGFADTENMRRYLLGYEEGLRDREALLRAHPWQATDGDPTVPTAWQRFVRQYAAGRKPCIGEK